MLKVWLFFLFTVTLSIASTVVFFLYRDFIWLAVSGVCLLFVCATGFAIEYLEARLKSSLVEVMPPGRVEV